MSAHLSESDELSVLYITRGPQMVEIKREAWEACWCFKCRKRQEHDAVLMVQPADNEPSYMGEPYWKVECHGCGEDHVRFPGTEDGPTLEILW